MSATSPHIGWLINSLDHAAKEERSKAARCRRAYTKEPFAGFCATLADAHEEAATAFQKRLDAARRKS